MQFNSWIFLVVFLPLLLFLYFILNKYLNKRWATYSLILGNLVFTREIKIVLPIYLTIWIPYILIVQLQTISSIT